MNAINSLLDHLTHIIPPEGVLVAGSGRGSWVRTLEHLDPPALLFVEADALQIERMQKAYALPETWQTYHELLWSEETELNFHHASNPALSGVIAPESLTQLWPNLTTRESELRRSTTIEQLLINPETPSCNWYIIDCLPALPILMGAKEKMKTCDLVLVRLLSDETAGAEAGSTISEVDTWMVNGGFRLITRVEEDHPQVYQALYIRDWKTKSHQEKLDIETLTQSYKTLQTAHENLQNEFNTTSQEKQALVIQLETSEERLLGRKHENATLQSQLNEQVERIKTLSDELQQSRQSLDDEKAKHQQQIEQKAVELHKQLETLRGQKEQLKFQSAQEQKQFKETLDQVQQEKVQLEKQITELNVKAAQFEEQSQTLSDELQQSRQSLDDEKAKHQQQIEQNQAQHKQFEIQSEQLSQVSIEAKSADQRVEAILAELTTSRQMQEEQNIQQEKLEEQNSQKQKIIEKLRGERSLYSERLAESNQKLNDLESQIKNFQLEENKRIYEEKIEVALGQIVRQSGKIEKMILDNSSPTKEKYNLKIGILSGYYPGTRFNSQVNHRIYASHHGYYYIFDSSPRFDKRKYIRKLEAVLEYLPLFDWIFWIDDDAYVTDINKQLESFIDLAPESDLIVCKSPSTKEIFTKISSGQFLIRNTPKAIDFINKVINTEFETVKKWWTKEMGLFTKGDQDLMVYLLETDPEFSEDFSAIIDHNYFNNRNYEFSEKIDEHFLVHFTGKQKQLDKATFCQRIGCNEFICSPELVSQLNLN